VFFNHIFVGIDVAALTRLYHIFDSFVAYSEVLSHFIFILICCLALMVPSFLWWRA